jgi:membrane fusion protein, copper/silver efflux system
MKRLPQAILLLLFLAGAFLAGVLYHERDAGRNQSAHAARRVLYYVDPMNPAHTSDRPGPAPCGMPMEPVYAEDVAGGEGGPPRAASPGAARITPEKQQMIGVRVEKVEITSQGHALRTLGRVAPDENRTYRLTASADGWVWNVRESTTGSLVQKDQLMATVYNYQFLTRQQQYLYALDFDERRQKAPAPTPAARQSEPQPAGEHSHRPQPVAAGEQPPRPQTTSTVQSYSMVPSTPGGGGMNPSGGFYYVRDTLDVAKLELYSLGAGDYQIQEISRNKQVVTDMEIRSPVTGIVLGRGISPQQRFDKGSELFRIADLSRVWILADVFQREARYIRPGATARVSLPDQGKVFEATVKEVPPAFDATTRTLKVRLEADNPEWELRPDMFVDVEFLLTLAPAVTVPAEAVVDSGLRKTVFVSLGEGLFEPRTVTTGWRFGERVEILDGLKPGEEIVVSGTFLIDSESRMKLAAAGLSGPTEKDPMSGMEVYPGRARKAGLMTEFEGKRYYFSSEESLMEFEKAHGLRAGAAGTEEPSGAGQEAMHGFVIDPVCKMPLPETAAKQGKHKSDFLGHTYHFCSDWCKNQFARKPEKYAGKAQAGARTSEAAQAGGARP